MLTKHAQFTPAIVHRSEIKNAAYNPRTITPEARRKLRKNIERVGLLEPIIWNRTTGHVVGGHQRLSVLDQLEPTADYLVPVAAVELDLATEKAQNVFLNNGEAQGEWDATGLDALLRSIPDVELTGFDMGDLYQIFGTDPANAILAGQEQAVVEKIEARKEKDVEKLKTLASSGAEREQGDFYLVALFPDDDARLAFTAKYGLPDNRYVDASKLERLIRGES